MTEPAYGEFIVKIMETLQTNGFPEKRVALPLEQLYESAHNKQLNFNKVLSFLAQKGIGHSKTEEKVIFFSDPGPESDMGQTSSSTQTQGGQGQSQPDWMAMAKSFGMENMAGKSLPEMMLQAQQAMKNMRPEDLAQIKQAFDNMSDDQKKAIMDQAKRFMNPGSDD